MQKRITSVCGVCVRARHCELLHIKWLDSLKKTILDTSPSRWCCCCWCDDAALCRAPRLEQKSISSFHRIRRVYLSIQRVSCLASVILCTGTMPIIRTVCHACRNQSTDCNYVFPTTIERFLRPRLVALALSIKWCVYTFVYFVNIKSINWIANRPEWGRPANANIRGRSLIILFISTEFHPKIVIK